MKEKHPKLKPCPFCGGKANLLDALDRVLIDCSECTCEIVQFGTVERAVKHWNTRNEKKEVLLDFIAQAQKLAAPYPESSIRIFMRTAPYPESSIRIFMRHLKKLAEEIIGTK